MPEKTGRELLKALESLETWFRWLAGAGVIAFCSTLLVAIGLYKYQETTDKEQAVMETEARIDRNVEFCKQENKQTERTREYSEDQLVKIFSIFSRDDASPEEISAAFPEEFEEYQQFIDQSFPYRDCSRDCVVAYTTPVPDCPSPKTFPD